MTLQGDGEGRSSQPADWPEPLREGSDEVAFLLRRESARRLEPGRPFFTVTQKRVQRQWRNISLAAFTGIFAATLWLGGAIETPTSAIVAEPLLSIPQSVTGTEHGSKSTASPSKTVSASAGLPSKDREAQLHEPVVYPGKIALDASAVVMDRQFPASKVDSSRAQILRGPAGMPVREDCALLSRSGQYKSALQCFQLKSQGEGTSAEIGFLEMARIQRRVLADTSAALETLERYQEKFPQGTLSWEADQLKQELVRKQRATVLVAE